MSGTMDPRMIYPDPATLPPIPYRPAPTDDSGPPTYPQTAIYCDKRNVENDKSSWRGYMRKPFVTRTCLYAIVLTLITLASLSISLYVLFHNFMPVKNAITSLSQKIEDEVNKSKWMNFTRELVVCEEMVEKLSAQMSVNNDLHKEEFQLLKLQINTLKKSLSKHSTEISHNNASISKISTRLMENERSYDKRLKSLSEKEYVLGLKIKELKARIGKIKESDTSGHTRLSVSSSFLLSLALVGLKLW